MPPEALWESLHQHEPPQIIDVREPREYRRAHVPGAKRISYRDLLEDLDQIAEDEEVVLVCQGGRRSRRLAALLMDRGYDNVQVLEGGIQTWREKDFLTAVKIGASLPAAKKAEEAGVPDHADNKGSGV